jgi:hypothetical protein
MNGVRDPIAFLTRVEKKLDLVNRTNLAHNWRAIRVDRLRKKELDANVDPTLIAAPIKRRKYPVNPCLRQHHAGELFRGMRLYSWSGLSGQALTKRQRRTIRIDGEPATELDYSGFAPRLLYHLSGRNIQGDVYGCERVLRMTYRRLSDREAEIARHFVKKITNALFHVGSENEALRSIRHQVMTHPRGEFIREILRREGVKAKGLLERLRYAHESLPEEVFFNRIGMDLMREEGLLMLDVLYTLAVPRDVRTMRCVPALGIHDGIVCRRGDEPIVREAMESVYRWKYGFDPVIKREF